MQIAVYSIIIIIIYSGERKNEENRISIGLKCRILETWINDDEIVGVVWWYAEMYVERGWR